ncbi:hypothetical protein [Desulfosporosinus sp. BG]|uniref:hypothetical protein n=1 Tax=Desulfosporosinus sp. BG TaxID=1633135 RepID=UPI00083A2171|nr:hypothetical protein [Desulfosporosinus sp. BG]ODA41611.1 hypothetical protein DSBG_1540 [Desulfosporosinus sp. BG]
MKVFIAGPRAISKLNKRVEERLNNIYSRQMNVIVGDAAGVDKAVQDYFFRMKYQNVSVYATQGKARNNIGSWKVVNVEVEKILKGFEFYAAKDIRMAEEADYGFMIWNGKSKGTLNNVINLINRKKKTLIYFVPGNEFFTVKTLEDLERIVSLCEEDTRNLFNNLSQKNVQLVKDEMKEYITEEQLLF